MSRPRVSWLRVAMLTGGLLVGLPVLTYLGGIFGFALALLFILLAAFAQTGDEASR